MNAVLNTITRHAESHRRMAVSDAYSAQEAPRLEYALAATARLVDVASKVAIRPLPLGRTGRDEFAAELRNLRDALAAMDRGE